MREHMFFIAFISLFYLVGFGLLGYGMLSLKRSYDAAAWPTTDGTLVSCELETNFDSDGDTHEVKVEYAYTVNGRELTNDVLAFGYAGSSGRDAHEQIRDKLEAAETVQVRYDPSDPERAVLSYGFHRSIQFTVAFAVTWLAFVVGFSVLWWLSLRPDDVLLRHLIVH